MKTALEKKALTYLRHHYEDSNIPEYLRKYENEIAEMMAWFAGREACKALDEAAEKARLNMGERGKAKSYLATDELQLEFGITVDEASILSLKEKY